MRGAGGVQAARNTQQQRRLPMSAGYGGERKQLRRARAPDTDDLAGDVIHNIPGGGRGPRGGRDDDPRGGGHVNEPPRGGGRDNDPPRGGQGPDFPGRR